MNFDDLSFRGITIGFAAENLLNRTDNAVVISCDKDFSLGAGLGKAFADRADPQFMHDVAQLRATYRQIDNPIAVSVPAAGLNCDNLILVPLRRFMHNNFDEVFSEIIQCAINIGINTLALPPIGSGGFNMDRKDVSEAMKTAFETQFNFGSITRITIVDSKPGTIHYFRNVIENMVADDLINNPNFYASHAVSSQNNAAAQAGAIPGTSSLPPPVVNAPFSMFYTPLTLDELKELHAKRSKEKMEIDTPHRDEEEALEGCPVCLLDLLDLDEDYKLDTDVTVIQLNRCHHKFHRLCLVTWFENKPQCPLCNVCYMPQQGNQPRDGTMHTEVIRGRIPGYQERSHIRITYNFPNGVQGDEHVRPGVQYKGTRRVCYLPNTTDGQEVLRLLEYAFERRLLFTVGDSVTSGQHNVVTWNGVHHKTNKNGGPANYGYPDPGYLNRVKQELASLGVTEQLLDADLDGTDEDDD